MKTLSSGVYSLLGSIYVRLDIYFILEFVEHIFTVYETGDIHESGLFFCQKLYRSKTAK